MAELSFRIWGLRLTVCLASSHPTTVSDTENRLSLEPPEKLAPSLHRLLTADKNG
jgi:hypothetical protein